MKHTIEDDFQHFLSYSGLRDEPADTINKMRMAFDAAYPKPKNKPSLGKIEFLYTVGYCVSGDVVNIMQETDTEIYYYDSMKHYCYLNKVKDAEYFKRI